MGPLFAPPGQRDAFGGEQIGDLPQAEVLRLQLRGCAGGWGQGYRVYHSWITGVCQICGPAKAGGAAGRRQLVSIQAAGVRIYPLPASVKPPHAASRSSPPFRIEAQPPDSPPP